MNNGTAELFRRRESNLRLRTMWKDSEDLRSHTPSAVGRLNGRGQSAGYTGNHVRGDSKAEHR